MVPMISKFGERNQTFEDCVIGAGMISQHGRKQELRVFLKDRRARLQPEEVGLLRGRYRRVRGLRREEVASLASVSVAWYTMFESGTAQNVSADTVMAIGRALRLTGAELNYLLSLSTERSPDLGPPVVDPLAARMLSTFITAPAYILTPKWDVLAWNDAFAVVWNIESRNASSINALRGLISPEIRAMHGARWKQNAAPVVAMARYTYGRHADDANYRALIEELLLDDDFRALWERGDVSWPLESSHMEIVSPSVGRFVYDVVNLELPYEHDRVLVVQVPDADSTGRLAKALQAKVTLSV